MNKIVILFLLALPFMGLCITMFINLKQELNLLKKSIYEYELSLQAKLFPPVSISIIMPIFNKYKYLDRSFGCLKNQTYQNYEIMCIDDFSSDNSSDYILREMKTDNRVKLIQHTYNQGICNTRIHGALYSVGKYIMSLDPDDIYYLDTLNFAYHKALETDADILEILVEARNWGKVKNNWLPCQRSYTDREKLLLDLQRYDFKTTPWNIYRKVVKNELYRKAVEFLNPFLNFKRINVAEDLLLSGAIFLFTKNWICSGYIGYVYFMNLPDGSVYGNYQSGSQNSIQIEFSYRFNRYFYKNRFNLDQCNLKEYLSEPDNLNNFNQINNLTRISSKKKCDRYFYGFKVIYIEQDGYCFIKNE